MQTHMRLETRTLVERASRWLINNRRPPIDSDGVVDFFGVVGQQVVAALPELLTGRELPAFESRRDTLVGQGVPEDLADPGGRAAAGVRRAEHRRDRQA